MKFARHFGFSRQSLWMGLLMAAVLIAAPVYAARDDLPTVDGLPKVDKITAIDPVARIIKVNDARYLIGQQAGIYGISGEATPQISIADLKVGQEVEGFKAEGDVITILRVFIREVEQID